MRAEEGADVRVLQLMKSLLRGGAEVLAASLASAHRSDIELVFGYFHAGQDTLAADIERRGAKTVCIPASSQRAIVCSADRVARLLRAERIDLVHCHLPLVGVVGRLAGALAGRPVVYTEHNLFSSYHPATRLAARATWPMQAHVIAVSDEVARSLAAVRKGPPITVVKNGVDVDRFRRDEHLRVETRTRLGIPLDALVVGTVAVFRPAKRLDRWLEVAAAIARSEPRAYFVLVGFGPLAAELRGWALASGLGPRLVMPGPLDDVRPVLSALDVYLMTSDFEGLPIALLEAMAAELPVVATAVGGIPEVVLDDVHGAITAPGDNVALAQRTLALLADPRRRAESGRAASARVAERHGLSAMARALEQIYDAAVSAA